jgi:hypothetical protein
MAPIGRLFFSIESDTSRLNASLQEAIRIAQDAGVKITRAGQSIISAFDEALNPTKKLAEQVKLLETAGKSSSDIWQVMGERMKTAADAARANSQAVDPLVQKHIDLAKASKGSAFSFESLGKAIQDFSQNPVQAAKSGIMSLLGALGPTAVGIGAVGTAAIAAGVAVFELAKNAAESAEQIKNLSYATGMTVEDVQALQRLGQERGLGDLTGMIEKLNAQLGSPEGGSFTEAILRMGIAIKEGAGATYYLEELRKHYAAIPDATKRAEQAAADLGKRLIHELGPAILNVDESITEGMEAIKQSGAIMSDSQVDALKKLNEQIEEHGRTWEWLKKQVSIAAGEATLAFMKMVEAFGSQPVLKDSGGKILTDNNGVPLTPNPYWNIPSSAKPQSDNIPFVGPQVPDIGANELAKRSRAIAEADAVAAGTKRELIGLTVQLNDLEKQYSDEKSKQKGLGFDAERLKSLAAQVAGTKELIKDIQDSNEAWKKGAEEAEKNLKKIDALNKETSKIQAEIDRKGHAALVPSDSEIDKYLKDLEKKTLDRVKIYREAELAIAKETTASKLEELRVQEQIVGTITPMNAHQREQVEIEKIHLQFAIKAEELRTRFTQERADLTEKISKLDPSDPLRMAAESDIENLDKVLNDKLSQLANLEAGSILKVHREEYQRMIDTVRDGAGQVFDALTSRGKGAFQNLMDWLEGTFLSGLRTLFQNFIESIATGFKGGFGQLFQGMLPPGASGSPTAFTTAEQIGAAAYGDQPGAWGAGSTYGLGMGGSFAMDYAASLQGGSFTVPDGGKPGMWANLFGSGAKGMDWKNFFGGGGGGFFGDKGSPGFLGSGTGGINGQGVGGAFGGMLMGGGMSLFMDSLGKKGAGAWAESIGGGAMTGFALGGPIGAAIGALVGLGTRLAKLAMGKNAYEAGSMEVSRDFGGINVGEDEFKGFLGGYGISEPQAYPNRKNLLSSPDFLKDVAWQAAQAQGKTEEFLKSLEKVGTSWGTFNFRPAFDLGRLTGDWSELNKVWKETAELGNMKGIGPEISDSLLIDDETLKPWEQLIVDLNDLKKSVQESIPSVKTMYQAFLEAGEITEDLRKQIMDLGGDIATFENVSDLTSVNNHFDEMVQHFRDTGEILPELRQMFADFGGDLSKLDDAAALPGLHTSLNFLNSLASGLENLAPELDPIKALLSGQWNANVISGLSAAGLDPAKFEGLSGMIGMEQNWSKIATPFTKLTPELEKALKTYGGNEGQLAVERYGQGFNTITEGLLNTTKQAMDEAYQAAIKDALDYIGTAQKETSDKITTLTMAIESQFTIVSKNITDAITDAKTAVVDALEKLILAAAYQGEKPPAATVSDTSAEGESIEQPPWLGIPQAAGGGLVEVHDNEAILDREQTRNLLRGGGQSPVIYLINPVIYGFQDFVDQVRQAGLDLQRRGDPQWA